MIEEKSHNPRELFDTSINVIGGIKDLNLIYEAIKTYFEISSGSDPDRKLRDDIELRTERSIVRVERAIKRGFLSFYNEDHKNLISALFKGDIPSKDRDKILFWQFALNNPLFRIISSDLFLPLYFSGRTGISTEDIIAFLKEFISQNKALNLDWSENTIITIARKYLNFMIKMGLLSGNSKKTFCHVQTSSEVLVLFLYFANIFDPLTRNILNNAFLRLSFVAKADIVDRFKKLSIKGIFALNYDGTNLNIDLTHSFKGICDVLYNRP